VFPLAVLAAAEFDQHFYLVRDLLRKLEMELAYSLRKTREDCDVVISECGLAAFSLPENFVHPL